MPLIDRPNELIKLLRLIRVQDLPDASACLLVNRLELRIDLLLQIPHLLRGLIENLADLLHLGVGEIQILLEVCHRTIFIETPVVLQAASGTTGNNRRPRPQERRPE